MFYVTSTSIVAADLPKISLQFPLNIMQTLGKLNLRSLSCFIYFLYNKYTIHIYIFIPMLLYTKLNINLNPTLHYM